VHNGRFRPLSAHYLRAGLDASGKLVAWHHRVAATGARRSWIRCATRARRQATASRCAAPRSAATTSPHQLVEQLYRDTGVRTNPLRGIGVTANKFATEVFMDEIARKRGVDPVAFRLELLKGAARLQGGRARGADGGMGPQARRPRARLRLSRLQPAARSPASPKCRSTARAARSRCTISGAPSTAASRCSPTTSSRRPRAASSTVSA
jgi:CO/xanthine dehydrogenase Mo-binding subunit